VFYGSAQFLQDFHATIYDNFSVILAGHKATQGNFGVGMEYSLLPIR
jgi:hypothetical protein